MDTQQAAHLAWLSRGNCFSNAAVSSCDQDGSSRNLDLHVVRDKILTCRFIATPGSSRPTERMAIRSWQHQSMQGESLTLGGHYCSLPACRTAPSFFGSLPPDYTHKTIFSAPTFPVLLASCPFINIWRFQQFGIQTTFLCCL